MGFQQGLSRFVHRSKISWDAKWAGPLSLVIKAWDRLNGFIVWVGAAVPYPYFHFSKVLRVAWGFNRLTGPQSNRLNRQPLKRFPRARPSAFPS